MSVTLLRETTLCALQPPFDLLQGAYTLEHLLVRLVIALVANANSHTELWCHITKLAQDHGRVSRCTFKDGLS